MVAIITTQFVVAADHIEGDYAHLHGNGGSGAIDWDTPIDNQQHDLFPAGAGLYGFGHAPFGHHRFGRGHSMRTPGFGHLPFGKSPFGHGAALITAQTRVTACGNYKLGFASYDAAGNAYSSGTPDETDLDIHIAPPTPAGIKLSSHDKAADTVTLDILTR